MARAKNTSRSAASSRRGRRPPTGGVWKPAALQRDYRTVLDYAKKRPQVIFDTDGELLVVERKADADLRRDLQERFAQLARFRAALAANRGREPREWASQTDFSYLASFDAEEVEEFARELLVYTLDAAQRSTVENLDGNLRAWRSSASIYEDAATLAAMSADVDPGEIAEVFPPTEEQAQAAAG